MIFWHTGITMLIVWFVMRGNRRIDYRIVAASALLPDVIDKSIGKVIFRSRFESGRIFAHTLILNIALFCLLFFMRGRFKRTFVLVPISTLLHLAEDGMWSQPKVFWWPLFGTTFPKDASGPGLFSFLHRPAWPGWVWQEAVGLAVILWLLASHKMLSRDGVVSFLRTGMLEVPLERAR